MTIAATLEIEHIASRLYGTTLGIGAPTTVAIASGKLYSVPLRIPKATTYTVIGLEITTLTTGNFRLGIYNDSGGVPGSLKLDAGAVALGGTAGFKSIAISQVLTPAWYHLAVVSDATPTVRALTASNCLQWCGFTSGTDTTSKVVFSVTQAYGVLPDPFTGGGALEAIAVIRLLIGP